MTKGKFALKLRQFAEKAGERMDESVRRYIVVLSTKVIMRSPVDTGRFRGNWQFTSDGTVPMENFWEQYDKTGQATISKIGQAIPKEAAGKVYHLTNNLPYGFRLEYDSWSAQAPNGMVGISVREFPQDMAQIVADVRNGN